MEEHAYRKQFELEDAHWWFVGRRAVIHAFLRRGGVSGPLRVLDAGCGTGRNMLEVAGLGEVSGVDPSADAIEFCRRRGIANVEVGRLEQLPYVDAAFDLILLTDVIEHIDDEQGALRELARVAAPDARLLITVPAYQWLWSSHDSDHHHFRRYTMRRLIAAVTAAGWRPQLRSYFNSILLAPIGAVRLAAPRRESADLELSPGVTNRLLSQPMRLEARIIERGARLPAGVSIGMLCRLSPQPARELGEQRPLASQHQ